MRLDDRGEWLTVVGVVADIRQRGLDQDVKPMIYAPFQQDRSGFIRFVSFVARTSTPASVVEGIRAEIRRAAPDLPIVGTVTMDEAVAASVAQPRFRMLLLVLFATAATLIATCGIYGLMAYAVTQRRREIGVRMALGAERRDVFRLVLTRALRIVVAGLIVGLAGAVGVTRVLQRFLFGVTPTDPIVVHDRHAAADGGGTDGGMAARAPRVKDRPVGRAARGIAVIRGVRHSGVEPSSQVWQHQRVRLSLRDSCWQALLVVLLFHCPLSAVARGETRHVLVLSSSERPFAPQSGFADALVRD